MKERTGLAYLSEMELVSILIHMDLSQHWKSRNIVKNPDITVHSQYKKLMRLSAVTTAFMSYTNLTMELISMMFVMSCIDLSNFFKYYLLYIMSVDKFGSSGGKLSSMASVDKEYVDQKFTTLSTNLATKINKSGDRMNGDLTVLCDKDNVRTFGVSDISAGKSVSLLLGDVDNRIRHNFGEPIKIAASYGMK